MGLPATSPNRPEPAATPGVIRRGENAPYSPNQQDTVYAQTYPQYPTATPRASDGYPPVIPPVYPGQPTPANYPGQPIAGRSVPTPPAFPGQPMPGGSGSEPPAYPVSQPMPPNIPGKTLPPVYPEQPVPNGKGKSRRGLIITLCVLLVLALCGLGITLFKVFTGEGSLAVGVKPAWGKPSKAVIEIKKEPRQAYTLYEPEKDKLLLLQPFKDGSGVGQFLDPKTGAKIGKLIALPKCDNAFQHPFLTVSGKIACAKKDTVKANQNKKYQFKEQIYADKHLLVGASPSATNAEQIVAYNPESNKLLWVQNLKKPTSVTCDGKEVYTTSTVGDSPSEPTLKSADSNENTESEETNPPTEKEATELEVMTLTGSSNPQQNPEKELSPGQSKPGEPQVAKDAIKNIDFAQAYLPVYGLEDCSDKNFWRESNGTPISRKMPSETTTCWATMQNGESIEKVTVPWDAGEQFTALKLSDNEGNGSSFFDSESFSADASKLYTVGYGDANGDGYLDALLITHDLEAVEFQLALFDPEDPEHPYISIIGGTQEPKTVRIESPGKITIFYPAAMTPSKTEQVLSEISISGYEITNYVNHEPKAG